MAKLALKGGKPEAAELPNIVPPWPYYSDKAGEALLNILRGRRWCRLFPGSMCERFEEVFAKIHHAEHGIAVANGTVALELALKTLGVSYGDEVIVPAVTFIATASAVTEVGGIPIFADVDPETGCISADSVEELITERTKGVIAVHYSGQPVDFDRLLPVVKKHDLFLVEDCAHAHGSEWKGRRVGAIGDMGGFSFQESKSLTAGEGGIVLTDSDELAERARLIHNIGRVLGKPGYIHYILASNYRMTEFQATLLLANLDDFERQVKIKHKTGEYLAERLRRIGGVEPLKRDDRVTRRGYYFFVIRYSSEEFEGLPKSRFIEALRAEGVPCDVGYGMPLYRQPAFTRERLRLAVSGELVRRMPMYERLNLSGAEEFCRSEVTLPHWLLLGGREAADLIANAITKIKENVGEILEG